MKIGELWINLNLVTSASPENMGSFCGVYSSGIKWKISNIDGDIIHIKSCDMFVNTHGKHFLARYKREYFIANFEKVY